MSYCPWSLVSSDLDTTSSVTELQLGGREGLLFQFSGFSISVLQTKEKQGDRNDPQEITAFWKNVYFIGNHCQRESSF